MDNFLSFKEYIVTAHFEKTGTAFIFKYFHDEIIENLEMILGNIKVENKKNLLINMPVRLGKTTLIMYFIEYALGNFPDSEFIYSSYTKTIALKVTVQIKNDISSKWYKNIFPDFCLGDKNEEYFFTTSRGGVVYAVGFSGSITGFGAGKTKLNHQGERMALFGGALIIDDPLSVTHRNSPIMLDKCISTYKDTLSTRANDKGEDGTPTIMIMQKLSKQDLSSFVMNKEGDFWRQLKFKALQEKLLDNGKVEYSSIFEEKLSVKELLRLKYNDNFNFLTQYQQEDAESEDIVFPTNKWQFYGDLSKVINACGSNFYVVCDTAFKTADGADFTVFQLWGLSKKYIFLVDQFRKRVAFPELFSNLEIFLRNWKKKLNIQVCFIEDKASGQSLLQTLKRNTDAHGVPFLPWVPKKYKYPENKAERAKIASILLKNDKVFLPSPDHINGKEWVDEVFTPEFQQFRENNTHSHDDQVDCYSMICSIYDKYYRYLK